MIEPKYEVPGAKSGLVLSTGRIKCGYWYLPERLTGQLLGVAVAAVDEDSVDVGATGQ